MITPSFGLTATERVLPRLALDFTTASLDPRVTFTRTGNTATVTNSSGVIVAINADLPRFDFNPTTLVCKGLLIEEARTNALLNSLIDGTDLATQLVTVTAAARTLSFYGTGTVVLSGTHSATVVGTGAYPARTTLTFTPSAGVLTLTVTGTVQFAQLETGAFATSFIPTAATAVTRNADVATMTSTNFSDWYNASEGTLQILLTSALGYNPSPNSQYLFQIDDGTSNNRIEIDRLNGLTSLRYRISSGGTTYINSTTAGSIALGATANIACSFGAKVAIAQNGTLTFSNVTLTAMPVSVTTLRIGSLQTITSGSGLGGWVQKINYWPQTVTSSELTAISK